MPEWITYTLTHSHTHSHKEQVDGQVEEKQPWIKVSTGNGWINRTITHNQIKSWCNWDQVLIETERYFKKFDWNDFGSITNYSKAVIISSAENGAFKQVKTV